MAALARIVISLGVLFFCLALIPTADANFAIFQASALACTPNGSDGYSGRPAGVSPQYPSLLSGYSVRPSWCVAGVDYGVGYPAATSLTPWATCLSNNQATYGAGITSSGSNPTLITVSSTANVSWNACDFTTGGQAVLYYTGSSGGSITNSRLGGNNVATSTSTTAFAIVDVDATSSGFTFNNNIIDWGIPSTGAAAPNIQVALSISGGGTITIEYNWFTGNGFDSIFVTGSGTWSETTKYNYIDNYYIPSGLHMNWHSLCGGTATVTFTYNTAAQTTTGGAEGVQMYGDAGGCTLNLTNPTLSNNVEISSTSGVSGTMSSINHGSNAGGTGTTNLSGTALEQNNYVDLRGTTNGTSFNYTGSFLAGAGNSAWTCTGNVNMVTGGTPSC